MDENQLKYQRIYDLNEFQLRYKNYIVKTNRKTHIKKEIVTACCKAHAIDLVGNSYKIVSIKLE